MDEQNKNDQNPGDRDQLVKELGIESLSTEEQDELINKLGEVSLKAATVAVLDKLPQEKQEKFAELAEGGDAKALQDFLDAEVPNHEELARTAIETQVTEFKKALAAENA